MPVTTPTGPTFSGPIATTRDPAARTTESPDCPGDGHSGSPPSLQPHGHNEELRKPENENRFAKAFVVGPSRSGTTLLAYLLGGGPGVMSLSEPYFARSIYGPLRHRWHLQRLARLQQLRFVPPKLRGNDADFLSYLEELAALNQMRSLVIKETFRLGGEWDNVELLSWLADSGKSIIGITRHPYDSAVSTLRMYRWWRGPLGYAAKCWVPRLPLFSGDQAIMEYYARNWVGFAEWAWNRGIAITKYEDLVRDTESSIRTICQRSGIVYDRGMTDPQSPRKAFGGIGAPEVSNRKPKPVHARSVGRKKELAPHLVEIVKSICADAACKFGYEL